MAILGAGILAAPAAAAEFPYQFEPVLSLRGDCATKTPDLVPDPSCPYASPPAGPSGRFTEPLSIAIDPYGNEYVASYASGEANGRIDVFDDEGHFITEVADPEGPQSIAVDSKGNLYVSDKPAAVGPGRRIRRFSPTPPYEPEAGNIEYSSSPTVVNVLEIGFDDSVAVNPANDHLFVNEEIRVKEFSSAEEGNSLLDSFETNFPSGSGWIAVDGQRGRIYVPGCHESGILDCDIMVYGLAPPHELLKEVTGEGTPAGKFSSTKGWISLAVDEETGHFFAGDLEVPKIVYEFGENYEYLSKVTSSAFEGGYPLGIAVSNGERGGEDAANRHFLFVPVPAGNAFAFKPPGVTPPEVESASAISIGQTEATVRASINPRGGATEYAFEYEEEGSGEAKTGGGGQIAAGQAAKQVSARLTGLTPGTHYVFRVVAKNEAGEDEGEGGFATYPETIAAGSCPNEGLRTGASALLPDCRAYELVTPPDTNGHPPRSSFVTLHRFPTLQSSPSGEELTYFIEGGTLPGAEGTGTINGDPYRASRGTAGWSSEPVGPNGEEAVSALVGSSSPDQGYSFWEVNVGGSAMVEGRSASYLRYPDGHSELIGRGSLGTDPGARGKLITEGGTHVVFQTVNFENAEAQKLEPEAPESGTEAIYDRTIDPVTHAEETHVVSLLPENEIPAPGENAMYLGASADGAGIAFNIGGSETNGRLEGGALYLRLNNQRTYEIGENAEFAGVSEGGRRIFYVKAGDLWAYDTEAEEAIRFTNVGNATV
ncbi:MAG: fibronectin type III domain-containing protein, partial [Solirubrobacterales bacterium]